MGWSTVRLLGILTLLNMSTGAAWSSGTVYHVTMSGNDANDCSFAAPCATIARVCDQITSGNGGLYAILIADGNYAGGCSLAYYNMVNVTGNCSSPQSVVIDSGSSATGSAFWAQDHAILALNCLTISSNTGSGVGIATRQYAIADYSNVQFGAMTTHVTVTEASKANCLSATIVGDTTYHIFVSGLSYASLSCPITVVSGNFKAFVLAVQRSFVDAHGVSAVGSQTGFKYILDSLTLGTGVDALPGTSGIVRNGAVVE